MRSNFWEWYEKFKQLIKCARILSTSKRASIGDFSSKISAAKAIAKGPKLTMNSFTQFLYNLRTFSVYLNEGRFQIITNLDPSIATKRKSPVSRAIVKELDMFIFHRMIRCTSRFLNI